MDWRSVPGGLVKWAFSLFHRHAPGMHWCEITGEYHRRTINHDCQLSSLATDWQRELAALWRLETDLNNGAYLQFLSNWGRASYLYASQALKKIGARRMAAIVDQCQALVDEHFPTEGKSHNELIDLLPARTIISIPDGQITRTAGSVLPETVVAHIYELSYRFMEYPENIEKLGRRYYRPYIEGLDRTPHNS